MRICTVTIGEEDYNLCLIREAVKWLENKGISLEDFNLKPLTFVDEMWTALFIKNYPEFTEDKCIELLNTYASENGDIGEVINFALEEYTAFLNALNGTKAKKKKAKITKA